MFDKYKRYRERQREGRVAVKVEYRLLLRQLRNLPLNITEVYATLSREGKIVKLPTRPAEGGSATWSEPETFVCTIYRDAVKANACEVKAYRLSVSGNGALDKATVAGHADLDVALHAFQGSVEQQLSLTVPIKLSKHGKEVGQAVDAMVDASITSRVLQRGKETEAASRQASGVAAADGAAGSTSSYSIASGLTSEGSQQQDQDLSASEQQEVTTASAVTAAANRGGRRGQRNDPGPPKDRTKSATRISHAQRRLKERAAMLAKPVGGDDSQPLGQGPPPTAHLLPGQQGARVEPEDDEAAQELRAEPLSKLPERTPSRLGATGEAAPLERVSPLGDIVLDAASLHIPSTAEPEVDVRGGYALPGSRLAPVRTHAESSEELRDGRSTTGSSEASEGVAATPRQPRSSGLVTGAVSLWDKGWAALLPSKGTPSHKQGIQDAVPEVPSEPILRTQSDIISTFGKGGAAAKSPVAPHPLPLPESELPYSSSSEDGAESDASSLTLETDHAAAVDEQVDSSSLLGPQDATRDEAHMQRIAAAASTLRTARLSMQASNQKYHLEPSSRTSSLERPSAARAVQRRPSSLSRGAAGTRLAAADLGSASSSPSPPSEAGSSRKLLRPPSQSGSPSKRQQRLDRVHSKARLRKAMAEEGKQEEERAEDDKQQDLSEDRQSIQRVVLEVADSTRGVASRAERLTDEVIRLAAVMEERGASSERRASRSTQSPRATTDQPQSSIPRLDSPQAAKPSNPAHLCNTRAQAPNQGVAAAASSSTDAMPPAASWETARDQRKLRELQLELQLAEERIALLESSDNPAATAGNHLRRSLNRNSSVHRLARTSSWKDLSATVTASRELKLSEELQQVRTCLAALRTQTSPSAGLGVLSLEEVEVALTGAEQHAAAAKELAELLKMDVLGSGSSPVEAHQFSGSLAELGRKAAFAGSEERSSSYGLKKPSGTENLMRQLSTNMTSDLVQKQRSASADAQSAELARLARELKTAQDLLKATQQEKEALAEQREQWQANGMTAEAQQEESVSNSDQHGGQQCTHHTELQREVSALQEQVRQQDEDAAALRQLLEPVSPASASTLQDGRPLQRVTDQLQVLLQQHSRLQVDNARLLSASPKAEKGKASERIAQLEREIAAGTLANEQLLRDLELMKRENGEDATGMAVKLAVAAKDADIARMQRQLAELEEQAQAELGDMHEELLEMRQACHALEIALNESEIKRNKMLLEKQQMEQQLQETAGELVEVERELNRQRALQGAPAPKDPQGGKLPRIVAAEDADIGPQTPPALHPGRARHAASEEAPEAGHIVLAGGALMAYDTLRRDFDSVMQELVQRKMELAELSEDYERVCHAFLRADEANNAPVLANLKLRGSLARVSLNADAR